MLHGGAENTAAPPSFTHRAQQFKDLPFQNSETKPGFSEDKKS